MRLVTALCLVLVSVFSMAWAAEEAVPAKIQAALDKITRGKTKYDIKPSILPNLYEVVIGGDLIYISEDGQHVVLGEIRNIETGENITENRLSGIRATEIGQVPEDKMIVFAPEDKVKYTINVFTDVDCPYCSKLHNEVPELNKAGVKVRYLAFPRAGFGSPTYNEMVSVWCAKDPQKAMTQAKKRQPIESATCANPVNDQFRLGQKVGISGTPAIVLESGELVGGYVPATRLIAMLNKRRAEAEKLPELGKKELKKPQVAK